MVLLAETPTERLSVGLDSGNRGSACVRLYLREVFAAAVDPAIAMLRPVVPVCSRGRDGVISCKLAVRGTNHADTDSGRDSSMKTDVGYDRQRALSRRKVLEATFAGTVSAVGGMMSAALAQPVAAEAPKKNRVRAIDIHAHYFPQSFFDLFNAEGQRFNAEFRANDQGFFFKTPGQSSGPLPTKFIDLKQRLGDMDSQGVAVHALSLTGPMVYWADGQLSHRLAQAWNNGAAAAHEAHPDRFVVLATLPMLDPDRAIDELNRVSKLPGVRGIYMGTNIDGPDLDDPLFEPILSRIEALDLPVFLHPLSPVVGGKRLLPHFFSQLGWLPVRHHDCRLPPDLRGGDGPTSAAPSQPAARRWSAAHTFGSPRPRVESAPAGEATGACPEHVSAAFYLRHHRAFEANYGVHHFPGGRRSSHAWQRLLLRRGLQPPCRSCRGASLELCATQNDIG